MDNTTRQRQRQPRDPFLQLIKMPHVLKVGAKERIIIGNLPSYLHDSTSVDIIWRVKTKYAQNFKISCWSLVFWLCPDNTPTSNLTFHSEVVRVRNRQIETCGHFYDMPAQTNIEMFVAIYHKGVKVMHSRRVRVTFAEDEPHPADDTPADDTPTGWDLDPADELILNNH